MLTRHPELVDTTQTILYRDTIIFVPIPGTPIVAGQVPIDFSADDTARIWGVVFSDSIGSYVTPITRDNAINSITTDTVYAVSGTAHARAWVSKGKLNLETWQTDSTYKYRIDSLKLEITKCDIKVQNLEDSKFIRAVNSLKFPLIILLIFAVIIVVVPRILKKK